MTTGGCSLFGRAPVAERSTWEGSDSHRWRPAMYRVERGDTLYSIAFRYGLDYHDVARWNGIGAPYTIYPDQRLRLRPPPRQSARAEPATRATRRERGAGPAAESTGGKAPSASQPPPRATRAGDPAKWIWPVREGRIERSFADSDPNRKGVDIAGREGQAVHAAAAGSVVYSGNGLSGYGELIIIKHSETLLSAYGYNRRRLVREGQRVEAGEQISEMGRSPRGRVRLHFEIRRQGEPLNPLAFVDPD